MFERLPTSVEECHSSVVLTWHRAVVVDRMRIGFTGGLTHVIPAGTPGWVLPSGNRGIFVADTNLPTRSVNCMMSDLRVLEEFRQASYMLPEYYWTHHEAVNDDERTKL